MPRPPDPVAAVRDLTGDDWTSMLDLVTRSMAEVPLYRWILGDELADDDAAARLLADLTFAPFARDGLHGAVADDGTVLGVCVWSAPDHERTPYTDAQRAAGQALLAEHPGVLRRLEANSRAADAAWQPERSVHLVLAAMDPRVRGRDLLDRLMSPMLDAAAQAGLPVLTRTSAPRLAQAHAARWNGVVRDRYTLPDDGPVVWVVERPADPSES